LSLADKRLYVEVDQVEIVKQIMMKNREDIMHFIRYYGGFTNNRLSGIYKWYRNNIDTNALYRNNQLAQDIYNISNFIINNQSESYYKTIRTLLSLVKDKYQQTI